jgi:hypothetical protein
MAAVVINPPRSRVFPETRFAEWLRMGSAASLAESKGRQKPAAQSKFRCYIIEIGDVSGFWRAALRITPHFRDSEPPAGLILSAAGTFNPGPELLALDSGGSTETGTL